MKQQRLLVGISGASGIIYGVRFVEALQAYPDIEVHLIMTDAARVTLAHEMGMTPQSLRSKVDMEHDNRNIAASVASGSFRVMGMVVVPCSMKTLAAIAYCQSTNLLCRAADVCLKERRPLILVPRETPLHLGHLRAMVAAAEMGAIILPPMPAFYYKPKNLEEVLAHTVGKILDQFGLDHDLFRRWGASNPEVKNLVRVPED
ncbi:MAG: UbiX family flavin prenyltransferase [Chloroflexi bacterium]|nr:UbiX family flavin prenyltransferase [Chloroflexota bacterium]